ncbi:hypothetical protein GQ55_3G089500 [Panicum hallii var. hallii]|jgi:myb proto-oncogene protein|uniref:Uncharacterized protein n=1 Tax=Panicum hallii var. hallii TaxID=1504633 RepID=A0A2T7E7A0_9POAL|nr:hypothetical protein GQ55_3G089500 [Panicum hallii var. hallii]
MGFLSKGVRFARWRVHRSVPTHAPLRRLRACVRGRSTEVHGQWRAVLTVCFLLLLCVSLHAAPLRHRAAGLRRTGKSCRLRWVNYLHPDLRRGRITADEERLIVQLHAQWGSRWSRIARSVPGRTDNEIKNFWRTRTRKKALEERRHNSGSSSNKKAAAASPLSSVTTASCCPGSPNSGAATSSSSAPPSDDSSLREGSGGDDAELEEASTATAAATQHEEPQEYCCAMDQLWNEIAAADAAASYALDGWGAGHCYYVAAAEALAMPSSPVWEYSSDYSLWRIDDEEYYREMLDAS